jgi:hypothetical protein
VVAKPEVTWDAHSRNVPKKRAFGYSKIDTSNTEFFDRRFVQSHPLRAVVERKGWGTQRAEMIPE